MKREAEEGLPREVNGMGTKEGKPERKKKKKEREREVGRLKENDDEFVTDVKIKAVTGC